MKWKHSSLHGPTRDRHLWERSFQQRFINGLTYSLTNVLVWTKLSTLSGQTAIKLTKQATQVYIFLDKQNSFNQHFLPTALTVTNLFQMNYRTRTFNHRVVSVVIDKFSQALKLVTATNIVKVVLHMPTNVPRCIPSKPVPVAQWSRL